MNLWTIGHSTRTFDEFVEVLQAHHIETIADVRAMPGSRKYPQFNQDALQAALKDQNISYRHYPALGGRRKPNPESVNTVWRHPSFRAYADYMESAEFSVAADDLAALAMRSRTALMCSEAVWWRCHRSMIADYFKALNWEVIHLMTPRNVQVHPYTSAARIVDGHLSYMEAD